MDLGTFQSVRIIWKSGLHMSGLSRVACIFIIWFTFIWQETIEYVPFALNGICRCCFCRFNSSKLCDIILIFYIDVNVMNGCLNLEGRLSLMSFYSAFELLRKELTEKQFYWKRNSIFVGKKHHHLHICLGYGRCSAKWGSYTWSPKEFFQGRSK